MALGRVEAQEGVEAPEVEGYRCVGYSDLVDMDTAKFAYSTFYPLEYLHAEPLSAPGIRYAIYVRLKP